MLNIISQQGNANDDRNEVPRRTYFTPIGKQTDTHTQRKADATNVDEDETDQNFPTLVVGNAKWFSHFGKQSGSSLTR